MCLIGQKLPSEFDRHSRLRPTKSVIPVGIPAKAELYLYFELICNKICKKNGMK